jgi:hypothetical protein
VALVGCFISHVAKRNVAADILEQVFRLTKKTGEYSISMKPFQ